MALVNTSHRAGARRRAVGPSAVSIFFFSMLPAEGGDLYPHLHSSPVSSQSGLDPVCSDCSVPLPPHAHVYVLLPAC